VGESESSSNQPTSPKEALYFLRLSGGDDIKILRFPTDQQVPNASANEIGIESKVMEAAQYAQGISIDFSRADAMIGQPDGLFCVHA
jgi:hypothetical protein